MAVVRILLFNILLLSFSSTLSVSQQPERDSLLKFKQSLKDGGALSSWAINTTPCGNWFGVYCQNQRVTGIHFNNTRIEGTIDIDALVSLVDIRTINFFNNSFAGPIPPFNKITDLKSLYLSVNQFSGDIPNDFFTPMVKLKRLTLDNNKFTGKIPESLLNLPELEQLNIQNNQFSGAVPPLKGGAALKSIDLSNNKLEGEIPPSYSKFTPQNFEGNNGLCGPPLKNGCNQAQEADNPETPTKSNSSKLIIVIIIAALVLSLLLVLVSSRKRKDRDFSVLPSERSRGGAAEVVNVHVAGSSRKPAGSSGKGGDSRKGSHQAKSSMGDLVMVNDEKVAFGLADLMKASAEVLGNGSLGSAYKAVMGNGLSVVVKRIREMNRIGRDEFDVEMRRFGKLSHPNILAPLAYHYRREEKLLVSEYMPKSNLLYVLHGDRGMLHAELTWPTRLRIIQGIGRGLDFLHKEFSTYELPHGNLKSSNILLKENYDPVLSDYAFHPLIQQANAVQGLFAFKSPEFVQYQRISRKLDVYCLGIIILEVMTGKFPSQYLSNGKGGIDIVQWAQTSFEEHREEELIDPEIVGNGDSIEEMVKLLLIGGACIASNPDERLDMSEAIRRIEEIQT